MDWSHPIVAVIGVLVGAFAMWLKRHHPIKVDLTIRHKEDDHDDR